MRDIEFSGVVACDGVVHEELHEIVQGERSGRFGAAPPQLDEAEEQEVDEECLGKNIDSARDRLRRKSTAAPTCWNASSRATSTSKYRSSGAGSTFGYTTRDRKRASLRNEPDVAVIVIFRELFGWLLSMYHEPHHAPHDPSLLFGAWVRAQPFVSVDRPWPWGWPVASNAP